MSARIAVNLALRYSTRTLKSTRTPIYLFDRACCNLLYDPVRNLMQCRCGGLGWWVHWCTEGSS